MLSESGLEIAAQRDRAQDTFRQLQEQVEALTDELNGFKSNADYRGALHARDCADKRAHQYICERDRALADLAAMTKRAEEVEK